MQRNLVLVVHGIGEQSAGETIDALAGGASRELGLAGPVESRTEMIAEARPGKPQLRLFPCTIRHGRIPATPENGFAEDQDVLAGEVYWSDLSPAPRGALATGVDLLRTVLTLGYLALDNVSQSRQGAHRWIRALVHLFVWTFYTLIAPMNALLLIGSFILLTDSFLIPVGADGIEGSLLIALMGALVIGGHLLWRAWIRRPESSYLERCFAAGMGGLGVLSLLGGLLVWISLPAEPVGLYDAPQAVPGWLQWLRIASCRSVDFAACWNLNYQDIAALCWAFVLLMALTWLMAVAILLAMFMISAVSEIGGLRTALLAGLPVIVMLAIQVAPGWPFLLLLMALLVVAGGAFAKRLSRRGRDVLGRLTQLFGRRERIYLPICNAMLFLWMLISAALWSLFSEVIRKVGGQDDAQSLLSQLYTDYSALANSTMSYIVFGVAGLVLVGVVPIAIRQRRKAALALEPDSWLDVWCGRVILNPVLNLLLMFLILWIAFGGTLQAVRTAMDLFDVAYYPWNTDTLIGRLSTFHSVVNSYNPLAIALVGLAGVLAYRAADFISAALGIARDISVYSARTLAYSPDGHEGRSSYAARERIKGRFHQTYDYLARQYPHDRLIVISHSQGTVVAAQALQEAPPGNVPTVLITMGSPLTHIYGQYFAKGFDFSDLPNRLIRWINIYRCDDFVGTEVMMPGGAVENHRVPPAGHTGYWTDRNVWAEVRKLLDPAKSRLQDRQSA